MPEAEWKVERVHVGGFQMPSYVTVSPAMIEEAKEVLSHLRLFDHTPEEFLSNAFLQMYFQLLDDMRASGGYQVLKDIE